LQTAESLASQCEKRAIRAHLLTLHFAQPLRRQRSLLKRRGRNYAPRYWNIWLTSWQTAKEEKEGHKEKEEGDEI
tara:strand:- start:442 stop:666 length:225 start_codon:yes stop_codon:yes gene_type:complete